MVREILTVEGVCMYRYQLGGECAYFDYPLNECWELTDDFYYTVSSLGVDDGTLCGVW